MPEPASIPLDGPDGSSTVNSDILTVMAHSL
jgi:hypothetical protein